MKSAKCRLAVKLYFPFIQQHGDSVIAETCSSFFTSQFGG